MLGASKKFKEYDQNVLHITILLSNITISTRTHVVRNSAKTNLQKHLNKLQIDGIAKTHIVCLHSNTFKRFGIYQYKYHHITVRFDWISDEHLCYTFYGYLMNIYVIPFMVFRNITTHLSHVTTSLPSGHYTLQQSKWPRCVTWLPGYSANAWTHFFFLLLV